jgi:hypothetical protein
VGSRRRLPSAIVRSILFSFTRTLAKLTRFRGAKWGATADSFQATLSHRQPSSTQLNPTSGHARPLPAIHRRCLLSSGSRVRILPGAPGFMASYLGFVPLPCQMLSLSYRAPREHDRLPHRQACTVSRRRSAVRSARRGCHYGPSGPSAHEDSPSSAGLMARARPETRPRTRGEPPRVGQRRRVRSQA